MPNDPSNRDHRGQPGGAPPLPPPDGGWGSDSGGTVRDHRGQPHDGPVVRDHRENGVKHIFVLMLENRSFDHMLGFSGITGTDATTGQPTSINGLTGNEWNALSNGQRITVSRDAIDALPDDKGPGHEFGNVLEQLCGANARYSSGGAYPHIDMSGFVSSYAKVDKDNPGRAMQCFDPARVPVLTALAREFVVCDHWFSSMPGPTEPNRMFVHAGTSGNFDESPTRWEITGALGLPSGGFAFPHGTTFSGLAKAGKKFRIYADDSTPNVAELAGISVLSDIREYEDFAGDVNSSSYDAAYTFIEPSYDALDSFDDGNSQHPSGSVAAGERFIKQTYEAIRRSPIWNESMLVILWDEHGGFYDHVVPPGCEPSGSSGKNHGFTFAQLGPRVPAIVVSPLIPKNLIEHRVYDHCAIPATIERTFNLGPLTTRTSLTSDIKHLVTLQTARADTPLRLPDAAISASSRVRVAMADAVARTPHVLISEDPRQGNIMAAIHSALVQHLQLAAPSERDAIIARAQGLKTHADALTYLKDVDALVKTARVRAHIPTTTDVPTHAAPVR